MAAPRPLSLWGEDVSSSSGHSVRSTGVSWTSPSPIVALRVNLHLTGAAQRALAGPASAGSMLL